MRLRTKTDQTDQFTESAYGELISRQEQLIAESHAIYNRVGRRRSWIRKLEDFIVVVLLLAMFSMGAWLGPVAKLVLSWFEVM